MFIQHANSSRQICQTQQQLETSTETSHYETHITGPLQQQLIITGPFATICTPISEPSIITRPSDTQCTPFTRPSYHSWCPWYYSHQESFSPVFWLCRIHARYLYYTSWSLNTPCATCKGQSSNRVQGSNRKKSFKNCRLKIITPVTEPTQRVSSLTYPSKPDGTLHICLDTRDLNKAIIREHYKAPTLEEISH